MNNQFVSIRTAARLTGISPYTIRKLYQRGELVSFPAYHPGQKNFKAYIDINALREMLGQTVDGESVVNE